MISTIASTQNNDWVGGVAFDNTDFMALSALVKAKEIINKNDVIYGFEASYHNLTKAMMITIFYTEINLNDFKASGLPLSRQDFYLPVGEFFDLFKRANFIVVNKDL